jgi:hypothetical protein
MCNWNLSRRWGCINMVCCWYERGNFISNSYTFMLLDEIIKQDRNASPFASHWHTHCIIRPLDTRILVVYESLQQASLQKCQLTVNTSEILSSFFNHWYFFILLNGLMIYKFTGLFWRATRCGKILIRLLDQWLRWLFDTEIQVTNTGIDQLSNTVEESTRSWIFALSE